ncbi:MAG TPA: zinc-dependent metalloprotease family protein [Actinomycetota bacterium]|nr:zinc-dependent metalloprotease family protein [Actinomycetota bacterium]
MGGIHPLGTTLFGALLRVLSPIALVTVLMSTVLAGTTEAGPRSPVQIDAQEDCLEPTPAAVAPRALSQEQDALSLDVLVLLDEVSLERGNEVMAKAQDAYTPLEIKLDYRFESVRFKPDEVVDDEAVIESDKALEQAKKWTGGARPADTDVVYVLTDKKLSDAAGRADCIGGVRYPQFAYAVGENYKMEDLLGVFYKNGTAKIAGHEIGHLMGAHHHYANCAEGSSGAAEEVGPTPCTLMFNYMDFISLIFGQLEASVVRGHTMDFASGGPDIESIHSTSVAFDPTLKKGSVASTVAACRTRVPVVLQQETADAWADVATALTKRNGAFRIAAPTAPGNYRIAAKQRQITAAGEKETCAQSASTPFTQV